MSEDKPANQNTAPRPLDGVRVLCVDAHPDICQLVAFILEKRGAQVVIAHSVAEGFDTLTRLRPNVLVAEMALPGEDGYALMRKVWTLSPDQGGQIPAMAMATGASPHDRERALSAGYQEYMAKPFEPDELVKAVAHLAGDAGKAPRTASGSDPGFN